MRRLSAVRVTYGGVTFRSTLEADWAGYLDLLGIVWQYEPEAVELPSRTLYRPDFYLPEIATWLEVKGPLLDRLEKTRELACAVSGEDPWGSDGDVVVVGLAPVHGVVTWQALDGAGRDTRADLQRCGSCGAWWWCLDDGPYGCRRHRRGGSGDGDRTASTPPAWRRVSGL